MIIGLSGYAKSGKDTVADMIISMQKEQWEVKKFSGKLKEIASLLTGIDVNKFEDQGFKEKLMPIEWVEKWMDNTTMHYRLMKVRDFLQRLGTDAIRDGLHKDTWVNALMSDYTKRVIFLSNTEKRYGYFPNWIITDCRFPNEFKAIKDKGGIVVRVKRDGIVPVNAHPSETALDGFDFDYVLENNGSLEDLTRSVTFMLNKFDESRNSI